MAFSTENTVSDFEERVIYINRCAKVVKGGRRFSFSALVVVGDKKGQVGVALGKASEVPDAIRKASKFAKKRVIRVPVMHGTLPHSIQAKFGASEVVLRPSPEGTGVIANSTVRAILECAGYTDVNAKSIRRNNPHNVVKATLKALQNLRNLRELASSQRKTHR